MSAPIYRRIVPSTCLAGTEEISGNLLDFLCRFLGGVCFDFIVNSLEV